jgi:hypothetical protein
VRMRNLIAELRTFTANCANLSHHELQYLNFSHPRERTSSIAGSAGGDNLPLAGKRYRMPLNVQRPR